MPEINDEELIKRYLKGDEKSLEVLIKRYLKPIYSFVYKYTSSVSDTEDITQETFVRMWRNIKKFDKQKKFKTWIFSIAKNASIDFLRKSRSASGGKKSIPFSKFDDEHGGNLIAEKFADSFSVNKFLERLDRKDLTRALVAAIKKLPSEYRAVIFHRYYDDYYFREIAELLGEPLNTVKSRYRRAVLILRNYLKLSMF